MTFSIKFRTQIRRTRQALFEYLERSIRDSVEIAGSSITHSYNAIKASFDEHSVGFWIDMLSVLRGLHNALLKTRGELYGYICIFSDVIDDDDIASLLRALASKAVSTGIWCTPDIKNELENFVVFSENNSNIELNSESTTFTELENIKDNIERKYDYALRHKVSEELKKAPERSALLTGIHLFGKEDALAYYCRNTLKNFMPLTIKFSETANIASPFVDALSETLEALFTSCSITALPEISSMNNCLFKERLRRESSAYTTEKTREYFNALLEAYCECARQRKSRVIIIAERIDYAKEDALKIFFEALNMRRNVIVYATAQNSGAADADFFPLVIDCAGDNEEGEVSPCAPAAYASAATPSAGDTPATPPDSVDGERGTVKETQQPYTDNRQPYTGTSIETMNKSLLEIAYTLALFENYFPSRSFIELLSEEGKNKATIRKTLEILYKSAVIRAVDDPQIEVENFAQKAAPLLGERVDYIKEIVIKRLLSWVSQGKLSPCYNLLEALHSLGAETTDALVLESIKNDINRGTTSAIENAIADGTFKETAGAERASVLVYCFTMLKNFLYGGKDDIKKSYDTLKPEDSDIAAYKAETLAIETRYKTALRDTEGAKKSVKNAMLLLQGGKGKKELPQMHRLFALAVLSAKEINDAIDYLSFALDIAEKNKDSGELSISAFYAAVMHFISGNLSKTERLLKLAEDSSYNSGRLNWALKAKFFTGRLYFETGRYKDALVIFQKLLERCDIPDAGKKTIEAWLFRTELYLYERFPKRAVPNCLDGTLFEIEANYLTGGYKECIEAADKFLKALPDNDFLFLEQPDWQSGFSQCELLEYTEEEFFFRMCTVWRSLALCRTEEPFVDALKADMQRLIQNERQGEYDPNASFYFFANYRVLNETRALEVDRNTAISIAFKRLQSRASRIDDVELRRTFLSEQYWNKILFKTAREYKLI